MKNIIFLKSFENKNNFKTLYDQTYEKLDPNSKNNYSLSLPDKNKFSFVFTFYDFEKNKVIYCKFLNHTPFINKYSYCFTDNYIPTMSNLKIFFSRNDEVVSNIYNYSYYDGSRIHIYATNYLESIDILLTIVNGKHYFKGFNDYNFSIFNEKFNKLNIDKLHNKIDFINNLYED